MSKCNNESEYLKHVSKGFVSYWHQVNEILHLEPQTVLEIGICQGIFWKYMRELGFQTFTLDFDKNLNPNILGNIIDLPLMNEAIDVIGCFEVLEHLPITEFSGILTEFYRVVRIGAVISVPDINWFLDLRMSIPKLTLQRVITIPRLIPKSAPVSPSKHGHHWHIGNVGFSKKRIVGLIKDSGFDLLKEFRVPGFPGHHFFVLRKLKS